MNDLIERQKAIDKFESWLNVKGYSEGEINMLKAVLYELRFLPSAQPESTRAFVELVVEYPDPELCTYKEYKGKPYYSIKYIENGETYVGYGTYNMEVLSQYLKEYFMSSVQPEITDMQAIEHLQETGWMQNHDKQMYEMGLREQLADDSNSYDALLPSAQPERKAWEQIPIRKHHSNPMPKERDVHLVTYVTPSDRRKINGEVAAWMPLSEPYRE